MGGSPSTIWGIPTDGEAKFCGVAGRWLISDSKGCGGRENKGARVEDEDCSQDSTVWGKVERSVFRQGVNTVYDCFCSLCEMLLTIRYLRWVRYQ